MTSEHSIYDNNRSKISTPETPCLSNSLNGFQCVGHSPSWSFRGIKVTNLSSFSLRDSLKSLTVGVYKTTTCIVFLSLDSNSYSPRIFLVV